LRIDQSTLCKRIQELESQLGFLLFDRSHQMVKLTEPGRKLVEGAREGVSSIERAVSAAKAANRGTDEILQIGKSPNTDPYSVSTILSIRLALFPGLKVRLRSNYSHELARDFDGRNARSRIDYGPFGECQTERTETPGGVVQHCNGL
jgi:DNA-binding transcriptional LysR family regulator